MPQNEAPKPIIEPLDPSKHDQAAFSCGVEQVTTSFRRPQTSFRRAAIFVSS
jgi:hypothetical protein